MSLVNIIDNKYNMYKIVLSDKIQNGYNVESLTHALYNCYKSFKERLFIRDLKIQRPYIISYYIQITKDEIKFLYRIPKDYEDILYYKIIKAWNNIKLNKIEDVFYHIDLHKVKFTNLLYEKEQYKSVLTDYRLNQPISYICNIKNYLKDNEQVLFEINFKPFLDNIKNSTNSDKISTKSVILNIFDNMFADLDYVTNCVLDDNATRKSFISKKKSKPSSKSTINKCSNNGFMCNLNLYIQTNKEYRYDILFNTFISTINCIKDDNNFVLSKKIKKVTKKNKDDILNRKINNTLLLGIKELTQFLFLPTKEIQNRNNIVSIRANQLNISKGLCKGDIHICNVLESNSKTKIYYPTTFRSASKPLIIVGPSGSGKSTLLENICIDICNNTNHSLIDFDYIKNCEQSQNVIANVKKENRKDVLVYDMTKLANIPSLAFVELKQDPSMTDEEIYKRAYQLTEIARIMLEAVQSESTNKMTTKMIKYYKSACMITFMNSKETLKTVKDVLVDYDIRHKYIDVAKKNTFMQNSDFIKILLSLDTEDKKTKKKKTKMNEVKFIVDRFASLFESIHANAMLHSTNYIDFVDIMENNKKVFFKMPEDEYVSKQEKDVIVLCLLTKIWLAQKVRGSKHVEPTISHIVIDEIHHIPASAKFISDFIVEVRKFGGQYIFAAQYLKQFGMLKDAVKATGSNYVIYNNTSRGIINEIEDEIKPYVYEDIKTLKSFGTLNVIKEDNKSNVFIGKAPEKRKK